MLQGGDLLQEEGEEGARMKECAETGCPPSQGGRKRDFLTSHSKGKFNRMCLLQICTLRPHVALKRPVSFFGTLIKERVICPTNLLSVDNTFGLSFCAQTTPACFVGARV